MSYHIPNSVINILFLITVIKCKRNSMEIKDNRSAADLVVDSPDRNLLEIKCITKTTGCHCNLSTLTKCKNIRTPSLFNYGNPRRDSISRYSSFVTVRSF